MEVREDPEEVEEKGVVVPVMLNCWDWARMPGPVGFCWTKLIWNPTPVGQPVEGPSTVVVFSEVRTFSFKTTLTLGFDCCRNQVAVRE